MQQQPEPVDLALPVSNNLIGVTINDLRARGKEVIFIPIFINDEGYDPDIFLKLISQLIYRFDKHAKNVKVFILVCDTLDVHLLLFNRGDIFKFVEEDFSNISNITDILKQRIEPNSKQSYELLAHDMSRQEGGKLLRSYQQAIDLLRSKFKEVIIEFWDAQNVKLKNRCEAMFLQLTRNNSDPKHAASFDIIQSKHFSGFIKRGLPILLVKPGVVKNPEFIIRMLNRFLFEKIVVFSSSIMDLQEKNPDKNVVLIYPIPISHRWHSAVMKLLQEQLPPSILYRLQTATINVNKSPVPSEKFTERKHTKHVRNRSTTSPVSLSPRSPEEILSPSGSQHADFNFNSQNFEQSDGHGPDTPGSKSSLPPTLRVSNQWERTSDRAIKISRTDSSPDISGPSPEGLTANSPESPAAATSENNENHAQYVPAAEHLAVQAGQSIAPHAVMFCDPVEASRREKELYYNAGNVIRLLIAQNILEAGDDEDELFLQFKSFLTGFDESSVALPLEPPKSPFKSPHS